MKYSFKTLTILAFASLALPTFGLAAPKKDDAAKPADSAAAAKKDEKPKKDTHPFHGTVVAIDATTLTIKGGEGKPDHKYAITKETKFVNHPKGGDAKDAKASDVKVGAEVGGLLKDDGKGTPEALSINVGVKQKEDKKGDDKPKTDAPAKKKKTT